MGVRVKDVRVRVRLKGYSFVSGMMYSAGLIISLYRGLEGFRMKGSGFWVQGLGFRVYGSKPEPKPKPKPKLKLKLRPKPQPKP